MTDRSLTARPTAAALVAAALVATAVLLACGPPPHRQGEALLRLQWSAPSGLSRRLLQGGAPVGPTSFAVSPAEEIFILDPAGARIVRHRRDGARAQIALPPGSFDDLALLGPTSLALLDRLDRQALLFLHTDGKVWAEVPLAGKGLPEPGAITALFALPDGVWVEQGHHDLIRIATLEGQRATPRTRVLGRPSLDGRARTLASRDGVDAAAVHRCAIDALPGTPCTLSQILFGRRLQRLVGVETDDEGHVYVAAALQEPAVAGRPRQRVEVAVVDRSGAVHERFPLPTTSGPVEPFRSLRVSSESVLYLLTLTPHEAAVWRFPR